MKKSLTLFFVAAMVMFASCKKDDSQPESPAQPQDLSGQLANTSWISEMQNNYSYSGVDMLLTLTSTLDFFENKEGEFFMDLLVTVPSMPSYPGQSQNVSFDFTYTFDGDNLVLTQTYVDPETGVAETSSDTCIYNKEDETILYDMNDEEMVEMMGTDKILFRKL